MRTTTEELKLAIVGHAGHGKSALAGRLSHGAGRGYVIIDAPGRGEFPSEIVTAEADAALVVIDAEAGIEAQTRQHAYLLHLLGLRQLVVAVDKMDRVDYSRDRFEAIERDYRAYSRQVGLTPAHFIPVSAQEAVADDNIAHACAAMDWYRGPTLLAALAEFQAAAQPDHLPLRFSVQAVEDGGERLVIAGRVETGVLRIGDQLLFSPANRMGRVRSIETGSGASRPSQAGAGESIAIALEERIIVERGDVASHEADPPIESDVFRARLLWLGDGELRPGNRYTMRLNSLEAPVAVQSIERVIDLADLSASAPAGEKPAAAGGEAADVTLRADAMLALDAFTESPRTGRFMLLDGHDIVGGGIISMEGYADQRHLITRRSSNIQRVENDVTQEDRERRNGHQGGVMWFTGLSGAGKSTVAVAVERRLFALGYQTYVLDGDNVRHGLNGDLGFSPEDRAENIRRIGEVAALISSAGILCITAFISPYRSDRDRARVAGAGQFAEIHIMADLATCERRDPKGLYKKARAGEIPDFTGISAPYEAPENPELVVDTSRLSIEETVDQVVAYVQRRFGIDAKPARSMSR